MIKIALRTKLIIAIFALIGSTAVFAQDGRTPFMQEITVAREPSASPTPGVQRTGSSAPTMPISSGMRTSFPALASARVPGFSGILIESMDGLIVAESNADLAFNPASNVKVATAYAVLKTFGPEFRFLTSVYTDGGLDHSTGTLHGNLYVSGRDPVFAFQHAVALANELNKLGIRSIAGDLVVTDNFSMNYAASPGVSAQSLQLTMNSTSRTAAANRQWNEFLMHSGRWGTITGIPDVKFTGAVYIQPIPSNLQLLFNHESAPVKEILKATLCFSNNFLSERLGSLLGGPYAVARVVHLNAGVEPSEFSIQTASGLGVNRVTPNAMMKLLRALRSDLARYKLTYADIMPVAGVDRGTLEGRFGDTFSRASVVGKTGTLPRGDGGVSTLAGEINTKSGKFLFVIFNQRGNFQQFRAFQNSFVSLVQGQLGGAEPVPYNFMSLDARLARSRITYPDGRSYGGE
jgi:D-alanyl-D-alanine carboxypeptidase/D-alanyl-D-alanine-endopeptidase (penicillin-binding protein 4)